MKLEEQYPNIWNWVSNHGTITIGHDDDFPQGFLVVNNPGGTCWESEEDINYDSLEQALDDLEANIKAYCEEQGLEPQPDITEHPNFDRLIEVDSSMLSAVKYDSKNRILEAWFNSGQIWHYHDVPGREFIALLESSSQGSYMRSFIIGEYSETRVKKTSKRK
jgi:KTSC domain